MQRRLRRRPAASSFVYLGASTSTWKRETPSVVHSVADEVADASSMRVERGERGLPSLATYLAS